MKKLILLLLLFNFFSFQINCRGQDLTWEAIYRKDEAKLINSLNERVKRLDNVTLQFKLNSGIKLTINDKFKDLDDDKQIRYVFRGIDENIMAFLVDRWKWEDHDILLIGLNDGRRYILPGIPIYNPTKNKFICIKSNILSLSEIYIYKLKDHIFEEEYYYKTKDWGVDDILWVNDLHLIINSYTFKRNENGIELKDIKQLNLVYDENKWIMLDSNSK